MPEPPKQLRRCSGQPEADQTSKKRIDAKLSQVFEAILR